MTRLHRAASLAFALALAASCARLAAAGDDLERRLTSGGRERSYLLHLPAFTGSGAPLPLVLVLHGAGSNAWSIRRQTGFSEEADWQGFAVAYANGTPKAGSEQLLGQPNWFVWNAGGCCGWPREPADDVSFLRAVVADAARQTPLDPKRIYVAGLSNGGMMAYRLACEASDLFAAIGVVAGALVAPACAPLEPVSVLHVHGTADPYVPHAGGPGNFTPPGFAFPSTASALELWRTFDDCEPEPSELLLRPGVHLFRWRGCREHTSVEYVRLDGGKHAWPGGGGGMLSPPHEPHAVETTALLLEFFASHPKP